MISCVTQSMLYAYAQCPEKFRRRYGLHHKAPTSVAGLRGSAFHRAAQVNHIQKAETGNDLPVGDLKDAARDYFVHTSKEYGLFIPECDLPDKKQLITAGFNEALACTERYRESIAPQIQPSCAERKFTVDIGLDLPLLMIVDYVHEGDSVGDLKSSAKMSPKDTLERSLQSVFYQLGFLKKFGRSAKRFETWNFVVRRNKDRQITKTETQHQEWTAGINDYRALVLRIRAFIEAVSAGVFPPTIRQNWWCTAKWCNYFQTCPYVGNDLPKVEI